MHRQQLRAALFDERGADHAACRRQPSHRRCRSTDAAVRPTRCVNNTLLAVDRGRVSVADPPSYPGTRVRELLVSRERDGGRDVRLGGHVLRGVLVGLGLFRATVAVLGDRSGGLVVVRVALAVSP